jgi:predicted component of type VI protein secretion system
VPVTFVVRRLGATPAAPAGVGEGEDHVKLSFDGTRITLGRSASCDVRLPDASVSGRHASVRAGSSGYVIVDEGSTNGTRLNGEKLSAQAPRTLKTGDVLLLGRIEIVVKVGAARTSSAADTRELALALVQRMLGEASTGSSPSVSVVEGPDAGATLVLDGPGARTIGRDPRCALKLTDRSIPPIALEVLTEGAHVRVVARDPRAGAAMGERALDRPEPLPWNDGVIVSLGATRLRLDDPLARALEASAGFADEKVEPLPPPEPEPPPPPPPPPPEVQTGSPAESQPEPRTEKLSSSEPRGADRRRSWRGATLAFELIALILGLLVLGASATGLWWLLHK